MTPTALRRGVIIAGIALILSVIAADTYEGWQDYRDSLSQSEQAARSLSRALAEQTTRMVQEVDLALTNFAQWSRSAAPTTQPLIIQELLRSELSPLPFIQSATIIDANGKVLVSTRDHEDDSADWSQRDVFTGPQTLDKGLYIGKPRQGSRDGNRTIALSRTLHDAQGKFAGVIVARLNFDYLSNLYAAVNLTPDASIRLLRGDDVVLAGYPDAVFNTAGEPSDAPRQSTENKALRVRSDVQGYAMSIEVAQPYRSALARWRQQEAASAFRTGTLAIFAALLIIALVSALRRRAQADQELLRLEKQLRETRQAETLGMFAASIAHDFNNVLGAIVGYGEIARDSVNKDSIASHNIQRLLAASERARHLVRRVLSFDMQRGLHKTPVSIGPIVEEVLDQVRTTLPMGITVRTSGIDSAQLVYGDATEIYQVILNLCSNAVRALPQGGVLRVDVASVTIDAPQTLNVGALRAGNWLCLSVSDNGVGIKKEMLDTIFEPFFTTKRVTHSAGIGLAVVANLVTSMGGAVAVQSEPGRGSTFRIYWPKPVLPAAAAASTHPSEAMGQGQTIMVVDDDAALVGIAEELLAALGYEPVGFTDPVYALSTLREYPERFDAILSDEGMPALTGSELAQAARKLRDDIKVVLMTGHRDADLNSRAAAIGVAEILDKPLRSEQLQATFARVLTTSVNSV